MRLDLKTEWSELCSRLGTPEASGLFDTHIAPKYSEPHRTYHNLTHIHECIQWLRLFAWEEMTGTESLPKRTCTPKDDSTLELALYFHDIVYNPMSGDNEERSAEYMEDLLERFGLDRDILSDAADLIELTKTHDPKGKGRPARYMLDIDLCILGETPSKYWAYEHGIRQEYSFVPLEVYNAKRIEVLKGFQAREKEGKLFSMPIFKGRFNNQARQNLAHAIAYLEAMPVPR